MKNRSSSLRRGSQLAVFKVAQEIPELLYQCLGLVGLKQDSLVSATVALHSALKDADASVIGEINLESKSGSPSVGHGDIVVMMMLKENGQTTVAIQSEDPRDTVRMLLGRGVLDSLENDQGRATTGAEENL